MPFVPGGETGNSALVLARCGARPILLERGRPVEHRQADVERFWSGGPLDPDSNVQFGEGGAGAFSDGKLNTGTKDLRHRFILETLVRCGIASALMAAAVLPLPAIGGFAELMLDASVGAAVYAVCAWGLNAGGVRQLGQRLMAAVRARRAVA